jgi:Zn-dependent protease
LLAVIARRSLGYLGLVLLAGGILNPPFTRGVLHAALFLAALVMLTVVRELGRLGVGIAVGFRPSIVEIGDGPSLFRVRAAGLLWHFKLPPVFSATIWSPPPKDLPLRARLASITIARPLITAAVMLAVRALGVPLVGDPHGAKGVAFLGPVVTACQALLMLGLFPFSIRGFSVIPFESDGLRLIRIPRAKREDLEQEFARFYVTTALEALNDGDPNRALVLCREGLTKYASPWSDVFRNIEAIAQSRAGDHSAAQAKTERDLARDLPPVARALALNSWSWFAFLRRDEADLHIADRRSADALVLQPGLGPIAGTRGAILLWLGRVDEALDLLVRGYENAQNRRSRDIDACLLAMAHAARGESARARYYLERVTSPAQTEGIWAEANRYVSLALEPGRTIRASRGSRSLVLGADGVECHEGSRVRLRLTASEIDRVRVGVSARGRTQLVLHHRGGIWRLPIDAPDITWVRMSMARTMRLPLADLEPDAPPANDDASTATLERAYQERSLAQRLAVSTPKGVLLLASAVAFAASMLFVTSSGKEVGVIVGILLIHELGHWIAMRAFGHHDALISFIPFLGAATMSKIPFEKRWQEIVMLLAGPLPGLVLGVALLLSPLAKIHLVASTAGLLIAINALNLLPLHPLDGGRIFHALITAGRPRFDLAVKTAATLMFLGVGLATKETILTALGAFGLLFWRQAYRTAELERRIRRTPGFDPRLPAQERRAYVFRALAAEAASKGTEWVSTVASLEMPLGYRRTPLWQIVLWAVAFGLCGGGAGLFAGRSVTRLATKMQCPARALGASLSCASGPPFAAIDWKESDGGAFKAGAFVWCATADAAAAADLATRLQEAEVGAPYCEALPWEHPQSGSEEIWRKARATQLKLRFVRYHRHSQEASARFERMVAEASRSPDFDPEVARLIHEIDVATSSDNGAGAESDANAARKNALAARLGPSPNRSCDRLVLHNVQLPDADESAAPVVSFSATMATKASFDALAGYLCGVGCSVTVLPASVDDRRLDYCF